MDTGSVEVSYDICSIPRPSLQSSVENVTAAELRCHLNAIANELVVDKGDLTNSELIYC
jgi:hypothetical protein